MELQIGEIDYFHNPLAFERWETFVNFEGIDLGVIPEDDPHLEEVLIKIIKNYQFSITILSPTLILPSRFDNDIFSRAWIVGIGQIVINQNEEMKKTQTIKKPKRNSSVFCSEQNQSKQSFENDEFNVYNNI